MRYIEEYKKLIQEIHSLLQEVESNIEDKAKAEASLRAGKIYENLLLDFRKALELYQKGFKLNPELMEALKRAKNIYKLTVRYKQVAQIINQELKYYLAQEQPTYTEYIKQLYLEMGNSLIMLKEKDKARLCYTKVIEIDPTEENRLNLLLEDIDVESGWRERVLSLIESAIINKDINIVTELLLRALKLSWLYGENYEEVEKIGEKGIELGISEFEFYLTWEYIAKAYEAPESLKRIYKYVVSTVTNPEEKVKRLLSLSAKLGVDYDGEIEIPILLEAIALNTPDSKKASFRLANLTVRFLEEGKNQLIQRIMEDPKIDEETKHLLLWLKEEREGEKLKPEFKPEEKRETEKSEEELEEKQIDVEKEAQEATTGRGFQTETPTPIPVTTQPEIKQEKTTQETIKSEAVSPEIIALIEEAKALSSAPPLKRIDAWKRVLKEKPDCIEAMDALIEIYESLNRLPDLIKMKKAKAEALKNPEEKIAMYLEVADMFMNRFSNIAEAIHAYETVLSLDPANKVALEKLKQLYETRKDWKGLVAIYEKEAESLEYIEDKLAKYIEIARIIEDKIKKPEDCIGAWEKVLKLDPENLEALKAILPYYERNREWHKLSVALEKLVNFADNVSEKIEIYQKLAIIYGDRLNDDKKSAEAWEKLLELQPQDRRVIEQLKKRYINLKAWDKLELLYEDIQRWDEFIRLLEREIENPSLSQEEKITLNFKIAQLWSEKLNKVDRASRYYEKILELDPENLDATEKLILIYQETNNFKRLIDLYQIKLKYETDLYQKWELCSKISSIYEERFKGYKEAFNWLKEAFRLLPDQEETRLKLEELASKINGWEEIEVLYKEKVDEVSDNIVFRIRLARILNEKLKKKEEAVDILKTVIEQDPENIEALELTSTLLDELQRYEELKQLYIHRIELSKSEEERIGQFFSIAKLLEEKLNDKYGAVEYYNSIIELAPQNYQALEALDKLYTQLERWYELETILLRMVELTEEPQKLLDIKYKLGKLREEKLGNILQAIETYREILELNPDYNPAIESLEGLLKKGEFIEKVCGILEQIYEVKGEWKELIRIEEELLKVKESVEEQKNLLIKIGNIYKDQLEDLDSAFTSFSRAYKLTPEDEELLKLLYELSEERSNYEELAHLLREQSETIKEYNLELAKYLLKKASDLYETKLEKREEATECNRRVIELDPEDIDALNSLERLYTKLEKWSELVEVLNKKLELVMNPEEKINYYKRIATIYEEMLNDKESAVVYYKEILGLDPENMEALISLDKLYEELNNWTELADIIHQRISLAQSDEEEVELKNRLAKIRKEKMNEVEIAIELYRDILEKDPENKEAISSLEAILNEGLYQNQVAELLEPIYTTLNEWQKLINIYEVQLKFKEEPYQRVELLKKIAELYENYEDNLEKAFQSYNRALKEDPSDTNIQAELERLSSLLGDYQKLVSSYNEILKIIDVPEVLIHYHSKIAITYEKELNQLEEAVKHWNEVLRIDPENIDALNSLERIFQLSEKYEQLAQVFLRKAEILPSLDEQKQYYMKAGEVYETLIEDKRKAIEVYRKGLELEEDNLNFINKLEHLYLQLEDWEALQEIYHRKVDLVETIEEKKEIYYVIGAIYETNLNNIEKAIDTYQKILELDPEDLQALQRLESLYTKIEDWHELLSILEKEGELIQEPEELVAIKYRIAKLWEEHLKDFEKAIDTYQEIISISPDHPETLKSLTNILHGNVAPLRAASVLEPLYQELGEWEKLIDVYEVEYNHSEDPWERVQLLKKIAQLQESDLHLNNPSLAFDTYKRCFKEDPSSEEVWDRLEALAEVTNRWEEVTQLYEWHLNSKIKEEPDSVIPLALRLASIYEDKLNSHEKAILVYEKVIEVTDNQEAIENLDRLYQLTEKWDKLAQILKKKYEISYSPEEALNILYRLAQLYQHELNDIEQAIRYYKEIVNANTEYEPAITALELLFNEKVEQITIGEILEPIYRMKEEWNKLVSLYEAILGYLSSSEDKVELIRRIAEIYENKLIDELNALKWLGIALNEHPLSEELQEEVERLAEKTGAWEEVLQIYNNIYLNSQDLTIKRKAALKLGYYYEQKVGHPEYAEKSYRLVLDIDAHDEEALKALDNIYTQFMDWEKLTEILQRRIEITRDEQELIELIFRLGSIYYKELGQLDKAIHAYRQIIDNIDPQHLDSLNGLEELYYQLEDWKSLYEIMAKKIEVIYDETVQADLHSKMAEIAEIALEDHSRAIEHWNKVLELKGEEIEPLKSIARIYKQLGKWREFVETLDRISFIVEDDEEKVKLYLELGKIWYEKLNDSSYARDNWLKVLDIDPNNLEALKSLVKIYEIEENWDEVVYALQRIIEIGTLGGLSEEEIKEYHAKLARIYNDIMLQPIEAIEQWRKVLEYDPYNLTAIKELERLYKEQNYWEEYVNILKHYAMVSSDIQEKISLYRTVAQVAKEELNNLTIASEAYEKILELNPLDPESFNELERIYTEEMRWESLIQLYLLYTENIKDVTKQIAYYRKIAEIYETKLKNYEQAFLILEKAFEKDYSDDETAAYLERMAGVSGKWGELLLNCNQALQSIQDRALQIELSIRIGKWYIELNRPDYAIIYFQQVLALDPNNSKALGAVGEIYRRQGQWELLVQILQRQVEVSRNPEEKKKVYVDLGSIYEEKLVNLTEAIKNYQKAIEIDKHYKPALESLERLYKEKGDWENLVKILNYKIEIIENQEELLENLLFMAEIYEERLKDSEKAVKVYRKVLELDSENYDALKGLERAYSQLERWQDLYDIFEIQYEKATTEKEKIELLFRMAGMLEEVFLKYKEATEKLETILDIDPVNENAIVSLERLYKNLKDWDKLIRTFERHIDITLDNDKKIVLFFSMGELYEKELKDSDRAIESYQNILAYDEYNKEALERLARLYEEKKSWYEEVDILRRIVEIEEDQDKKVALYYKMGYILDNYLENKFEAINYYQQAIELNPAYIPALSALRKIYYDNMDWLNVVRILEQEQEYTENPQERSKLLYELGRIHKEYLEDPIKAIEFFESAIEFDPENELAALPLVDVYVERENWEPLIPILEMLIRKQLALGKRDNELLHKLYYTLGTAASKVGDAEKAIKGYKSAYELNATHLPTLKGLALLYYDKENLNEAFKLYKLILVNHKDELTQEETVDIFYKLGIIKYKQGERRNALNMFNKALEIDQYHKPTILALIDMYEKQGNMEQVLYYKRQLLDIAEETEKFELLVEMGEIAKEKLKDMDKAIEFYNLALQIQPKNHVVLHKLLDIYTNTKQWHEAIDIIERIASLEDNPKRLAKYYYSIAVIYRDEIKDAEKAIEYFNKSLDNDVENLKAFESIDKILTQQKNWKEQERNYRRMLHRIKGLGKTELEASLWHFLGEIYRSRLKQLEPAAEAFKMASILEPEDSLRHEILATLYEQLPDRWEDAVKEYQWLIRKDPYKTDYYKALRRIYLDTKQYDKAWCVCATLTFLKKADPEEQQFYERYKVKGLAVAKARLDNERWVKDLFHPEEDVYIGKIFEVITRSVRMFKVQSPKVYGLKKKEKVDLINSTLTFTRTFVQVAQVLGLPYIPDLYLKKDQPIRLQYAITDPPASVVGAALLSGFSPQDLTFIIAKHLSYYRGEHYIRWVEPVVSNLKLLLLSALKIAIPQFQLPQDPSGTLQQTIDLLNKYLLPQEKEALIIVAKKFVESSGQIDIKKWVRAIELTSIRAAFLLTNDLEIAARIINTETMQGGSDVPPSEKIKELVLFSISEEYFRLRKTLGITITQ